MRYSQLVPGALRRGLLPWRKLSAFSLLAGLLVGGGAEAQWNEPINFDIDFDNLSSYGYELITLGQEGPSWQPNRYDTSLVNDSGALQRAIDDVAAATGGGTVIVPPGTYKFINVSLKSNVHLVFDDCTLVPYVANQPDATNFIMIHMGNGTAISNASVRSRSGARSDFELWNPTFPDKQYSIQAISCKDVTQFLIQNFTFWDKSSSPSHKASVGLHWRSNNEQPFPNSLAIPCNGTINQLKSENAHYGYGTIQVNTGDSILFSNIDCRGGVALRLESDSYDIIQKGAGGIYNITAHNITSREGQSAVKVTPHARRSDKPDHGDLTIDGATSIGSEFAVEIAKGSTHTVDDKPLPTPDPNITYVINGYDSISVTNVNATFTSEPRVTQWKHLPFYHPFLYTDDPATTGINEDLVNRKELPYATVTGDGSDKDFVGPSIAPVLLYQGFASDNISIGNSNIVWTGFTHLANDTTMVGPSSNVKKYDKILIAEYFDSSHVVPDVVCDLSAPSCSYQDCPVH